MIVLFIMGKEAIQTIKNDLTNRDLYLKGFCLDEANYREAIMIVSWR